MVKVTERKQGGWRVDIRIRLPDRSFHRERIKSPVASKSGSQRWGEARERHLFQHGPKRKEAPATVVPTLGAFWPRFIADGVANRQKASTIEAKETIGRLYLLPALGDVALDRIDTEKIARLKASLARTRAAKTTNNILTVLSKALHVAIDWTILPTMPCKVGLLKVAPPEMRFLEDAELDRLLAAASEDTRIAVLLGADAGLRLGEMVSLRWTDLDLVRGILYVRRSTWRDVEDTPKGGRGRTVELTARLRAALKGFRHLRGEKVIGADAPTIGRRIGVATKRAGLPYSEGAHILRHTFCTRLAMAGAPARAIQELAGHRHLQTTMRYMHLSPRAREGAIRLLDVGNPVARPVRTRVTA
jgi:integrase